MEKIILAIFIGVLFFIGPGILFDHRIKHDFPYGYFASDSFQHQIRAEAIKDAGNFKEEAFYISKGFEGAVGRYPPIIYHIAVISAYAMGIEVYDSIYFIVIFFAILSTAIIYTIIKDFNKHAALISLPLSILAFAQPASAGILWGHWPSLLAQSFLIAFAWCLTRIDMEKSYILLTIIFTSIILSHTSEAIFAVIFLLIFVTIRFISRKLAKSDVKIIAIALALSFAISFYYIDIFLNTWAETQPYSFVIEPLWEGNPGFYISGFGLLLIFITAGIIFSLINYRNVHVSLIFAFAMLLSGYMNYIGFGLRSFQIRFFWPLYLSVFFGFGVYALIKFVLKQWNMAYPIALFAVLTVLLTGTLEVPLIPHYKKFTSQGIMDPYHWAALKWLSRNTEIDSKIYFFYGDIYSQDALLRNSKRTHYQADPDSYAKAIQEGKIERSYISELPGDGGGGIKIRKGFFNYEMAYKNKPEEYFFGPQNICKFDYLIFDKVSGVQALAQYNLLIAAELLKKDYISKAFENEVMIILKNKNIGADCIEERSF